MRRDGILEYLRFLWQPGEVRELRVPKHNRYKHTAAGWFQTPEELADAALSWDGKQNVFVTLNPVSPSLLARANGRVDLDAGSTTSDKDVTERTWLFIDIDPVRPSGISSTDEEVAAAREVARKVCQELKERGWPEPGEAMSGNGCYLLYPAQFATDDESNALVSAVLKLLAERFSTPGVHIDPTVSNAARIIGVVGTLKVKGDALPDRPHRRSKLESAPEISFRLTREDLEELVAAWETEPEPLDSAPTSVPSPRTARRIVTSLAETLSAAGIEVRAQPPDARGYTWYHVRQCPFHEDGQPFECGVGQRLPDGGYAGHCFHPEGAGLGWQEWKVALGLGPSSARPASELLKLTDIGNAERLARDYGDSLRYCRALKCWFRWDGRRWALDETGAVQRLAKATVRQIYREAADGASEEVRAAVAKHAIRSESHRAVQAMLALAEAEEPFAIRASDFDRDPWVLNCLNGTLDLRTGLLHPHRRDQLITKVAPVAFDPDASDERLDKFLNTACQGDLDLKDFLQVFLGYGLTGVTSEEKIAFLHGPGGTGKGTLVEAVKATLGDYAVTADFETFLTKSRNGGPRPDIARLAGARLVIGSEVDEGRRFSTGVLKQLTGGDTVTARFLYGKDFEFVPQFKLVLVANHAPALKASDSGAWRRLMTVPFTHRIPDAKQDPSVKAHLRTDARPAILAWLVRGCLRWQKEGLTVPVAVSLATAEYRMNSDPFAHFFEDKCAFVEKHWVASSDLYRAYKTWAANTGVDELASQQDLATALEERGCTAKRASGGTRGWIGVRLSSGRCNASSSDADDASDAVLRKSEITRSYRASFGSSASLASPASLHAKVPSCASCGALDWLVEADGMRCERCGSFRGAGP